MDDKFYHLHPELLENYMGTLCETCLYKIRRSTPEVPKFNIVTGIDFGNPERLGLKFLTVVEEPLIAQSGHYVSTVKLIGTHLEAYDQLLIGFPPILQLSGSCR
jgi:hypothetical protein